MGNVVLDLPELMQEQISAAQDAGFYASETELVAEAIRVLLAARPDVRIETACRLYARGSVSIGKAADLAELDLVSFKRALYERGISRVAPETLEETKEMAARSLRVAKDAR